MSSTEGQPPKHHRETWLREKYWQEKLTLDEMGELAGVSDATLRKWMDRHGIDRRSQSEASEMYNDSRIRDSEWLHDKYWSEGKTLTEIGELCSVTFAAVQYWMNKHEIPRRDPSHAGGIDPNSPLHDEDWLRLHYVEKFMSSGEIGDMLGRDPGAVLNWLRRHGIEVRSGIGDYPPEKHPTYKGERTAYGAGWTNEKKKQVRDRDARECQDCGLGEDEHLERYGTKHHVHHIQPSRALDDPEELNDPSNLITLCQDCHLNKWDRVPFLAPDRGGRER